MGQKRNCYLTVFMMKVKRRYLAIRGSTREVGGAVTLESKGRLSTLVNEEVAVLRRRVKVMMMVARLPVNDDDVSEQSGSPGL